MRSLSISPLSTAAIGAAGAIGAFVGGGYGSQVGGIPAILTGALASGALGLELGERCFYANTEISDLRANSLDEFCRDRSKILSVIKSHLLASSVFCFTITKIPSISLIGSLFYLAYSENAFDPAKQNYILSSVSLGAIGTAGIIAGGMLGNGFDTLPSRLGLALAGGFLGLRFAGRYLDRYLRKEYTKGMNLVGQYFHDRLGTLNILKYSLLVGALWNIYLQVLYRALQKECSIYSDKIICLLNPTVGLPTVLATMYAIYKTYQAYSEKDKLERRWVFKDKKIRVFQEDDYLKLEMADLKNNTMQEQLLCPASRRQLAHFQRCEVILLEKGDIDFTIPEYKKELIDHLSTRKPGSSERSNRWLDRYIGAKFFGTVGALLRKSNNCSSPYASRGKSKPRENHWGRLTLLPGKDKMFWQLRLTDSKEIRQMPFSSITFEELGRWVPNYQRENRSLTTKFDGFKREFSKGKISKEQSLEFLRGFQIKDVINRFDSEFCVELKPLITLSEALSFFDPKVRIFNFKCAVTLVCTTGSNLIDGQHAAIIIERIKDGKYCMQMAHLYEKRKKSTNEKKSKIKVIDIEDPRDLRFTHRTECYRAPPSKVNEMFKSIEEDALHPPKLILCGGDSLLADEGQESCITWAKKKLLIAGIEIEDGILDNLITITTLYTTIENDD